MIVLFVPTGRDGSRTYICTSVVDREQHVLFYNLTAIKLVRRASAARDEIGCPWRIYRPALSRRMHLSKISTIQSLVLV